MVTFSELTPIRQVYLIIVILVSILALIIGISMTVRYMKKKTKIMGYLASMVSILAISLLLDPIFFGIYMFEDIDLIDLQTYLSLGTTGIANIFLLRFVQEVFSKKKNGVFPLLFILIEIIVLPLLMVNYFLLEDNELIGLAALGIHLLLSSYLYIMQWNLAFKLRARITKETPNDKVSAQGLKYIGLGGMLLFFTYLSFVLQEVAVMEGIYDVFYSIGFVDASESSVFLPLGFLLAGISTYMLYIGYFAPAWIKRRWEK